VRAYDLTGHSERVGDTLDLAVVIVNYETGACLERCLRSLERARGDVSVDVVVIDNASGDGSADVSEARGARLIRNDTNRWLSPAWNQGAAATQTPYLLFLNPDTEWFHGTLADLVVAARRNPQAGIVGPMLRKPDGTVYPSGRRFLSLVDAIGHAFLSPFTRNNPFTRRYELEGWDRSTEREVATLPAAWLALRTRAELAWLIGRFRG
jgi:N-acetylglucosaminyl-diphospho-decaprenol L-rhamnosyltransferase